MQSPWGRLFQRGPRTEEQASKMNGDMEGRGVPDSRKGVEGCGEEEGGVWSQNGEQYVDTS